MVESNCREWSSKTDWSSFAASIATTDRLVRTMVDLADVPLYDAVRMITITPASIMGIADRKDSLVPGKDADIIILIMMFKFKRRLIYNNKQ